MSNITTGRSLAICPLNLKFTIIRKNFNWWYFFELSARHLCCPPTIAPPVHWEPPPPKRTSVQPFVYGGFRQIQNGSLWQFHSNFAGDSNCVNLTVLWRWKTCLGFCSNCGGFETNWFKFEFHAGSVHMFNAKLSCLWFQHQHSTAVCLLYTNARDLVLSVIQVQGQSCFGSVRPLPAVLFDLLGGYTLKTQSFLMNRLEAMCWYCNPALNNKCLSQWSTWHQCPVFHCLFLVSFMDASLGTKNQTSPDISAPVLCGECREGETPLTPKN